MTYRIAGGILAAALLGACGQDTGASAPPAAAEPSPPPLPEDVKKGLAEVATEASKTSEDPSVLVETGELVSPVRSELAVKSPGRVGKVFVDEGARVRRGQPLLELENDYLKIEVDRAEAAVARTKAAADEARRDFERKEGLLAKGSVSQALYDRTRATLDQAEAMHAESGAALNLARQKLEDAVLRSPIDGIVAERRTDVGERLGEASVAFVIVQVSPLRVRFRLPERYLASAERGQIVRARVDPYPDEVFEGKVTTVVRAVDAATRTFVVEAEIANRDERLKPGLFARVELDLRAEPGS
ncbi:MAG: efflux RND transporter periplasmic adaptor subunit [Vicinamibacteria bacterium]